MTNRSETEALIRNYLEACNSGNIERMLEYVSEDITHDVNQGERRHGKSRFHAFIARMAHHYQEELTGIQILVSEDGTRAAAEYNVAGTYKETEPGLPPAHGETYQMPMGVFFAIDNAAITRLTSYYNLTDWIMQVTGNSLPEAQQEPQNEPPA